MKFKELPRKEQEGYVIYYTNPVVVKIFCLCYPTTHIALQKLYDKEEKIFRIEAEITRTDGGNKVKEVIKASPKEVFPILERLIDEGRYFLKAHAYKDLLEIAEKESRFFQYLPDEFLTDALVEHYVSNNRFASIRNIPPDFITPERLLTLVEKDYASCYEVPEYHHLLTDEQLLELIIKANNKDIIAYIPQERWNKPLLYNYLQYCVKTNRKTGFENHMCKLPSDLKDSVYYKANCMLSGFFYSKIPDDMKEKIISKKLIAETIRRWDLWHEEQANNFYWNGLGWMLQYLPKEYKTLDVCVEVCKRYPYAIQYVPDDHIKTEIFWEQVLTTWDCRQLMELTKEQEKMIPDYFRELKKDTEKEQSGKMKDGNWEDIIAKNGAKIFDLPKERLTADMILLAMTSNAYAVERDLSIVDELLPTEKRYFWEQVVERELFRYPISVPEEYMCEEKVIKWIKRQYSYEVEKIHPVFRTEKVLLEVAKEHPDRFDFPSEYQTQMIIDTIISLQEKAISKAMILKKTRKDLIRSEWVEDLCMEVPMEMITLSCITKDQINNILEENPHLITYAPMWYINGLRNGDYDINPLESENQDMKESSSTPISRFIDIDFGEIDLERDQMTLFDFI